MGKFLAGFGVGIVLAGIAAGCAMYEQERAHQAEISAMNALMDIQNFLAEKLIERQKENDK